METWYVRSKPESMGIFQHDGPVVEGRSCRMLILVIKTTVFIVYDVKIVPFAGIVTEPEIENEVVLCVDILCQYACRYFGIQHV
jgi:hypothetical protein